MKSRIAAPVVLVILFASAQAQQSVYVVPSPLWNAGPYKSPGSSVVDGINAGQQYMNRAQEEQDRREQARLDRELEEARLQQMRDMARQHRELSEQGAQLGQQSTGEPLSGEGITREAVEARARQLSAEMSTRGSSAASGSTRDARAARSRQGWVEVPIRDDAEGWTWCGAHGGSPSSNKKHCLLSEKDRPEAAEVAETSAQKDADGHTPLQNEIYDMLQQYGQDHPQQH